MTFSFRQMSLRDRLGLLALVPIGLLFALVILFPPDGVERADWAQFIGRFHLLILHFPIALILLVPVLELAGRNRHFPGLRASVDFVLGLATFSAIVAAFLGWSLARSGAYAGSLVTQHMWGGVFLAAVCWLCWMLHGRFSGLRMNLTYAFGLAVMVGLVSWTGYRGGQLSQGENHLTEHMPAELRGWLGIAEEYKGPSAAGSTSFFVVRVEPVFAAHCTSCHGPSKRKSHLRLDTYEAVMRGGKGGPVIKAGNVPGSELFHRVTLQVSDDKFMPAEGKRPLSADEVKLVELWITAGASPTVTADAIKDAPANIAPAVAEVTFQDIDTAAVAIQRAPLAPEVAQLQKRFPDVLQYESRGSAGLVVNVSLMGAKFGDEELAALRPIDERIVIADFSGTAMTDRSAASLAAMKNLRVLRLMRTKITDTTMQALGGLNQLESLSVFGTAVTPAALQVLAHLPKLQHLYAGETKVPPDVQVSEGVRGKLSF
jgi:Planctomycete cytochrome C